MATLSAETRSIAEIQDEKLQMEVIDHERSELGQADLVSHYASLTRTQIIRKFTRAFIIGVLVASAGIYAGYTTSIPGSIVGNVGFIQQFGTVRSATGALSLDAQYVALWGAINYVTQAMAQFASPFTAQQFGIRFNMWLFTMFKVVTIITEILSTTWWHFFLAKIFNGFASGLISTSVLSYASEITMPQARGTVLSAYAFFFALGQLASAVALQVINTTQPMNFRLAFYSQFVFLGLWIPILVLLPESAVWLYKRGNVEKAKRSKRRILGNVEGYDYEHEFAVFAQDVDRSVKAAEASSKYSMVACLKGTNLRRTLISTSVICAQNFVGVPLMLNVVYFFSLVGLTNAFVANLILFAVLLAGLLVSFFVVDKVGRRPLLLGGIAVMTVTVTVFGGLGFTTITPTIGNIFIALMALWAAAYALSIAPIGWIALVEMSTPSLRVQTAGVASLMQSCVNVLFNYCVPYMLSAQYAGWAAKTGLLFGGLATLTLVGIFFFFPETKGRGFAEMDEMFEARVPARKFRTTKTVAQTAAEAQN